MRHKNIRRAALSIAYNNGAINRYEPESKCLDKVEAALKIFTDARLSEIDDWLGWFEDDELDIVCNGDSEKVEQLLSDSPPLTNELLNLIFESV